MFDRTQKKLDNLTVYLQQENKLVYYTFIYMTFNFIKGMFENKFKFYLNVLWLSKLQTIMIYISIRYSN